MIKSLLNLNPDKRPSVHEILKTPFIKNRIKEYLTETQKKIEFDHTILHNKVSIIINNL